VNMQPQLIVRIRNVYGCPTIYPVNETASAFAKIAGTKTLSHPVLCEAEKLGFSIVVEPEPVPQSVAKWARA
jgi:hypothetical protein